MPSGSLNASTVSPKRFCGRLVRHALLDETVRPVADGALRHPEHGLLGLADAEPARSGMLPREEGQDRAGLAGLVAVVEVVGAGIVEVDGLLDQAQAERAGVEVEVAAGRARDGRDVVDAVLTHGRVLSWGGRRPGVAPEISAVRPNATRFRLHGCNINDCIISRLHCIRKGSALSRNGPAPVQETDP